MTSMLEMLTTDEFATWFDALEDAAAEEVACAMEMVQELGPERVVPDSSEWLLWYEHPDAPEFVARDDWADFQESTRQMVAELESPHFTKQLRTLPHAEAHRVMVALDRLKMGSAVRRRGLAMLVAGAAARSGREVDPYAYLRQAYGALAAATGLGRGNLAVHSSALRELIVRVPSGRVRLLYGVDLRRNIALAVMGERLDRCFYGDSVRRAERTWKQFLQESIEAREGAPR